MEDNLWPKSYPGRNPVWIPTPDISDVVNEKIMSAFCIVQSFPLKRIIIQFWRPARGKALLVCAGNPYAFSLMKPRLSKYRDRCCCYSYNINVNDLSQLDKPMSITGDLPSTTFFSGFPEVVMDLRLHRRTPLVDLALDSELTCFMMLPVFDETSSCVGVIEVSARLLARLLVIFNELKHGLLTSGLKIARPKAFMLPFKNIGDLKLATSETEKALQEAIHSHRLTLGQVWITQGTCDRVLIRKLSSHCAILPDDMSSVENFYNGLVILRLGKGEGLVGWTLETHHPQLCRNNYKLKDNRELLALLFTNTKCTSFMICLRSSHTRELDYVFEFFWPQSRNHLDLMEDLLLALREHLPSFKYVSGAQLGNELLVVDVENSILSGSAGGRGRRTRSGNRSTNVKIFPRNKLSMRLKRGSIKDQSELIQADIESENDNDEDLVIVAIYKVDYRVFYMPNSPTFQSFMEKIYKEFDLSSTGTYTINYQILPGEWYSLTDDSCLKTYISSYRASKNIDHVKLYVHEVK